MASGPKTDDESSADDEFLRKILASRVRETRKSLKIPQHELAAQIGTKQAYIFLVEAAEANVTLKTLARLAKALKVDPRDLLRPQPLQEVDDLRSRELDTLVQSAIASLHDAIGSLARNASDLAKVKGILKEIHGLLAEKVQSAAEGIDESSETAVDEDE